MPKKWIILVVILVDWFFVIRLVFCSNFASNNKMEKFCDVILVTLFDDIITITSLK